MKLARLAVLLALFSVLAPAHAAEPSPPITLEGILAVGDFFGPPDYGENPRSDQLEHSLYLQLPAPPAAQLADSAALASFGPDARQTYFAQIVMTRSQWSAVQDAIGHKVQVTGVPFAPISGHHRMPLLIEVRALRPIDDWDWQPEH
jgi:hypothetical protein